MKTKLDAVVIAGCEIQIDRSGGQGHCWSGINALDIPVRVREEIEGEIINGSKESCEDFVASDGQHYRW